MTDFTLKIKSKYDYLSVPLYIKQKNYSTFDDLKNGLIELCSISITKLKVNIQHYKNSQYYNQQDINKLKNIVHEYESLMYRVNVANNIKDIDGFICDNLVFCIEH